MGGYSSHTCHWHPYSLSFYNWRGGGACPLHKAALLWAKSKFLLKMATWPLLQESFCSILLRAVTSEGVREVYGCQLSGQGGGRPLQNRPVKRWLHSNLKQHSRGKHQKILLPTPRNTPIIKFKWHVPSASLSMSIWGGCGLL